MSRICVKNLPKHVDDKMLREHFSAKGEVTDAKLMRTKEGKTRQFAFIGFRTEDQAHEAIRYFNQTFINTCRISCELARQVGDPEIPRPWSRHTKEKEKEKKENENKKKSAVGGVALKGHGGDEEDEKLKEFLEVMQPRTKSKLWTNDTVVVAVGGEKIAKEGRRVKKEMEEEQAPAEMEVEESVEKNDEHNVAKDEVVSDMEYFKSRVKKEWSDSESSDSDDDQEEEKEDNEKEEEEGEKLDVKVQPEVGELIKGVESVFGELDGQVLEECDPSTASKDEKELEGVDTCRLFVRNLPYTATENELEDHFSRFGEAQVHLVIDKEINRSKGIAFVHYTHQESAQRALEELDDSIFQGRLLHVMPAKQKNPSAKTGADDSANQAPKSLKQQREEKKKAAEAGGDTRSWNSLFIRPETAVDIIARKYGVSKSEFLDADDVAVRVAQAQTQVIALSKKGLTKAGINVESLENLVARKDADMKRSNHIILVKNLPDGSSESELSNMFGKFGTLDRVIMPSTKTFALIVFFEPSGARAAFKGLHYKKYKDVPLYLEWAPANILSPSSTAEKNNVDAAVDDVKKVVLEQFAEGIPDDLDPDRVESRTLYVKNLNFKTSDEVLKKHFSEQMNEGRILSAKVKKHLKNGKNVSMGFGFVEFDSVETAKNVCKDLQETILDGHVLKLQHTRAKQDVVPKKVVKDRSSTKLIVRNVAFEATEKELRKLFSTYGEIKSLRLPKRLEQHRAASTVGAGAGAAAAAMPLCFLSARLLPPPLPLISCRVSSPSARTLPSPLPHAPPPTPSLSLSLSPNSSPPPACALDCPHFESCSGCTHEFNLHRPPIVDEATEFFKNLGLSDFTFDSCKLYGWRCRAKLAVRGSPENPLIGLYQEGTHNVTDIPDCKAHHPNINAAVELLKRGIAALSIEPYDEDQGTGDLRYVQMAVTTYSTSLRASERYKSGKVQVSLVWNSRNENSQNSDKLQTLANFLWRNGGPRNSVHLIHSVWANFQTSTNNIIFGNRWRHLLGERDFWEHVGGIDISLAPSSFGQANTRAFDTLLRKLHKYVPFGASVADLYAGAGVIGLSLAAARKCRSVRCIEINKESKLSFEKTVDRLPNLVDSSISWHHADTSKEPVTWIMGSDVLVVDPPRKGLDASLIDALRSISSLKYKARLSSESSSSNDKDEKRPWMLRAREDAIQIGSKMTSEDKKSLPRTLIYISCGWESFKEDCEDLLSSKAWRLEKAHGFNFFPGTQSIEVLAVFKRGQGVSPKKKKSVKKKKKKLL